MRQPSPSLRSVLWVASDLSAPGRPAGSLHRPRADRVGSTRETGSAPFVLSRTRSDDNLALSPVRWRPLAQSTPSCSREPPCLRGRERKHASRPSRYRGQQNSPSKRSPLPNRHRFYRPMWKSSRPLPDVEKVGGVLVCGVREPRFGDEVARAVGSCWPPCQVLCGQHYRKHIHRSQAGKAPEVCCRSVQRLVHHYCCGTICKKRSGRLAERFLRSKAIPYKEDTSGLVCKNPAHELLTEARCLRRSEGDPSIV
jgi:hypothetical protein